MIDASGTEITIAKVDSWTWRVDHPKFGRLNVSHAYVGYCATHDSYDGPECRLIAHADTREEAVNELVEIMMDREDDE